MTQSLTVALWLLACWPISWPLCLVYWKLLSLLNSGNYSTGCICVTVPLLVATCRVAMDTAFYPDYHILVAPTLRHQLPSTLNVEFANLSFDADFWFSGRNAVLCLSRGNISNMINLLGVFCCLEFWSILACNKWEETISTSQGLSWSTNSSKCIQCNCAIKQWLLMIIITIVVSFIA